MTGFIFIGGKAVASAYVSDGQTGQLQYAPCKDCHGEGVIKDANGEPAEWCGCTTGEACRQAGNAGGAAC